MKFARVEYESGVHLGLVQGRQIRLLPGRTSLVDLIEQGSEGLAEVRQLASSNSSNSNNGGKIVDLNAVRLLAPVDRFRRDVLCTGWNYYDHFTEGIGKREGQEVERPKAPTFFTKSPDVVIGPYDNIAYDARLSTKWDYEAEIAVIIGKTGRSIPADQAMSHVWGYCLANDISQRDLQRRHGGQWLKGKSIDATMPLGPYVTLAADIDLPKVRLQCLVNGDIVQNSLAGSMAFTVAELIAELSLGMTLHAGDVLLTGTPSGVGHARNPPFFLHENDEVIVRSDGLGELCNSLRSADLYGESGVNLGA